MTDMETVYLSGPIKDTPNFGAAFEAARIENAKLGREVVNPCDLGKEGYTYEQFMKNDIMEMLGTCDSIFMLLGWEKSAGARCEHLVAVMCGLKVYYQVAN